MAVLLEVLTADGRARRCDANCHGALHPACDCVCGGLYHGRRREVERIMMDPDEVQRVRERVRLGRGETIQLRFGA